LVLLEGLLEYVREAIDILSRADKRLVFLAVAIYYFSVLIYAYRWHIILEKMRIRLGIGRASLAYLMGVFVNNITPSMKAGGEIIRVAYAYVVTRAPLTSLVNSVVFERITESIPVTALALIAILFEAAMGSTPVYHIIVLGLLAAAVYFGVKYWDRVLEYALDRLKARDKFPINGSHAVRVLMSDKPLFIIATILSTIVWVFDALRLYIISLAVGWHASFVRMIMASILYLVIGFVALTPGGLGIVEGGLAAVFAALGAPPGKALAIVFIERLISYALATATGGLALSLGGGRQAWILLKSRWLRTGFTRR
jgi:uncharacterized protein (TIRG00374 family)